VAQTLGTAVRCEADLLKSPRIPPTGDRDLDDAKAATEGCLLQAERILHCIVGPPAGSGDDSRRRVPDDPIDVRTQAYLVPAFLHLRRLYEAARRKVDTVAVRLRGAREPGNLVRGWLDPNDAPSHPTAHHAALDLVRAVLADCFTLWQQVQLGPGEARDILDGLEGLDDLLERSAAADPQPRSPSALRYELAAFLRIFPQFRSRCREKRRLAGIVRRFLAEMTQEAARASRLVNSGRRQPAAAARQCPSDAAIKAYRMKVILGVPKQTEIAKDLSRELGKRVTQGQVSRWLKQVEQFLTAGGVLPPMPDLSAKKPMSLDPSLLDLGARVDDKGRAKRQRQRRSDI
jgi:hypothetical protein